MSPNLDNQKVVEGLTQVASVAIIFHENEARERARFYLVTRLAAVWEEMGITVHQLYGAQQFIPADMAIMHVDLSVVPDEYIALGERYPVCINGRVRDIRRSRYTEIRLRPGDSYQGPVIIKSDFNYAGAPERRLSINPKGRFATWRHRCCNAYATAKQRMFGAIPISSSSDYRVLDDIRDVPWRAVRRQGLIVEKFLPERDGDANCLRIYKFFGDREDWTRLSSHEQIIKGNNYFSRTECEPHPDVAALRHRLGFDFGKFDYVVHGDRAYVLDANKTIGAMPTIDRPEIVAVNQHMAEGVFGMSR